MARLRTPGGILIIIWGQRDEWLKVRFPTFPPLDWHWWWSLVGEGDWPPGNLWLDFAFHKRWIALPFRCTGFLRCFAFASVWTQPDQIKSNRVTKVRKPSFASSRCFLLTDPTSPSKTVEPTRELPFLDKLICFTAISGTSFHRSLGKFHCYAQVR